MLFFSLPTRQASFFLVYSTLTSPLINAVTPANDCERDVKAVKLSHTRHEGKEEKQRFSSFQSPISALGESGRQAPAALQPRKNPFTPRSRGPVGPRASLNMFGDEKISCPDRDLNSVRSIPFPSSYTDFAASAP